MTRKVHRVAICTGQGLAHLLAGSITSGALAWVIPPLLPHARVSIRRPTKWAIPSFLAPLRGCLYPSSNKFGYSLPSRTPSRVFSSVMQQNGLFPPFSHPLARMCTVCVSVLQHHGRESGFDPRVLMCAGCGGRVYPLTGCCYRAHLTDLTAD